MLLFLLLWSLIYTEDLFCANYCAKGLRMHYLLISTQLSKVGNITHCHFTDEITCPWSKQGQASWSIWLPSSCSWLLATSPYQYTLPLVIYCTITLAQAQFKFFYLHNVSYTIDPLSKIERLMFYLPNVLPVKMVILHFLVLWKHVKYKTRQKCFDYRESC